MGVAVRFTARPYPGFRSPEKNRAQPPGLRRRDGYILQQIIEPDDELGAAPVEPNDLSTETVTLFGPLVEALLEVAPHHRGLGALVFVERDEIRTRLVAALVELRLLAAVARNFGIDAPDLSTCIDDGLEFRALLLAQRTRRQEPLEEQRDV